ncbi:hypothetical protein E6O75_ATG00173 [Venturia nashicola]|uniref:Uncharacterized protein n=1 Tax=Venturia nashicola TaxID=86259 RepID=A0A4Z1PFP0_9PEZI|nr:hypothetical protein E6O75_ATG00173 [Venturia nashicola]
MNKTRTPSPREGGDGSWAVPRHTLEATLEATHWRQEPPANDPSPTTHWRKEPPANDPPVPKAERSPSSSAQF